MKWSTTKIFPNLQGGTRQRGDWTTSNTVPHLILRILKHPKYLKEQLRVQIILRLTLMRSLTERRIQNTPSFIRLCLL